MDTVLQSIQSQSEVDNLQLQHKTSHSAYKKILFLSRQLNKNQNSKEIINHLFIILKEIVPYHAVAVLLKEEFSNDFYLSQGQNLNLESKRVVYNLNNSGYIEKVYKKDRITRIVSKDSKKLKFTIILVPLQSQKKGIGVLVIFQSNTAKTLTNQQYNLLSFLKNQVTSAIEDADQYQNMAMKYKALSNMKSFLENSLESMTDGLFAIDMENKISLFNTAAASLLGLSANQAIGSELHTLFDPEFAKFLDRSLEITHVSGKFENEFKYRYPETDKIIPLNVRCSTLKNEQNESLGIIMTCQDLSDQKELINLRHVDQLKQEFISSISHELRTPLSIIKSFAEIMIDCCDQDPVAQKQHVEVILKQTNHLVDIINNVIDLVSMNKKDFLPDLEPVNVQKAFEVSMESLGDSATSKNIKIISKFNEDHVEVIANFNRLVQVFMNLIQNAIKFSPENNEIKIWSKPMRGKRRFDCSTYLKIAVMDKGIGIPKTYHKVIFEKFKQVSNDPATKPDGNGLGLSICKTILEKLKGNIWVESEVNKGSIFFFTLPLAE